MTQRGLKNVFDEVSTSIILFLYWIIWLFEFGIWKNDGILVFGLAGTQVVIIIGRAEIGIIRNIRWGTYADILQAIVAALEPPVVKKKNKCLIL